MAGRGLLVPLGLRPGTHQSPGLPTPRAGPVLQGGNQAALGPAELVRHREIAYLAAMNGRTSNNPPAGPQNLPASSGYRQTPWRGCLITSQPGAESSRHDIPRQPANGARSSRHGGAR